MNICLKFLIEHNDKISEFTLNENKDNIINFDYDWDDNNYKFSLIYNNEVFYEFYESEFTNFDINDETVLDNKFNMDPNRIILCEDVNLRVNLDINKYKLLKKMIWMVDIQNTKLNKISSIEIVLSEINYIFPLESPYIIIPKTSLSKNIFNLVKKNIQGIYWIFELSNNKYLVTIYDVCDNDNVQLCYLMNFTKNEIDDNQKNIIMNFLNNNRKNIIFEIGEECEICFYKKTEKLFVQYFDKEKKEHFVTINWDIIKL